MARTGWGTRLDRRDALRTLGAGAVAAGGVPTLLGDVGAATRDGDRTATRQSDPRVVSINSPSDVGVSYSFTVTGTLQKSRHVPPGLPHDEASIDPEDTVSGRTAEGFTKGGVDSYRYTGSIESFQATDCGVANVWVDDEPRDACALGARPGFRVTHARGYGGGESDGQRRDGVAWSALPTSASDVIVVGRRGDAAWALDTAGDADRWNRTYHSAWYRRNPDPVVEDGFKFALPTDDGVVLVGWIYDDGPISRQYWGVAVGPDGAPTSGWRRTLPRPRNSFADVFYDGIRAGDGFVLVGVTNTAGADDERHGDGWVAGLDSTGELVWEHIYNPAGTPHAGWNGDRAHDEFLAIEPARDGGFVVAGETTPDPAGDARGWVLSLDADGARAGDEGIYSTARPGDDYFTTVVPTDDGGHVLGGVAGDAADLTPLEYVRRFTFDAEPGDAWVMKRSAGGDVEWERTFDRGFFHAGVRAGPDRYVLVGSRAAQPWAVAFDGNGDRHGELTAADVPSMPPTGAFTDVASGAGADLALVGVARPTGEVLDGWLVTATLAG